MVTDYIQQVALLSSPGSSSTRIREFCPGGVASAAVSTIVTPFNHPQGEGLMPLQPVYTGALSMIKAIYVCIRFYSQDEIHVQVIY